MQDHTTTVTTTQPSGASLAGVAQGDSHAFPVDVDAPSSTAAAGTTVTGAAPPADSASSSSSGALGGRCSTPISVHFRNLTAVMQDKDWRGRVKKQHTIVKVSGRMMWEQCDIRHSNRRRYESYESRLTLVRCCSCLCAAEYLCAL